MSENEMNPPPKDPRTGTAETEMSVNQYGRTKDSAVVIDEADRTVLLTPDETVVFEKEPAVDIVPKNRPRNVYAGMWGRNEIATVTLGVFALLVLAILYFFLVVPSNRQLARHRDELDNLSADQMAADARFGDITSTETQVTKLISSEENFEANYLPPMASGRNELYQRLNGLIAAYGLVNTAGPDYAALDASEKQQQGGEQNQQENERGGRDRFRSLFPGIYVSMTVEGSYQNIRRFIKELESGRDFVVVSTVQIEPSDNTNDKEGNSPAVQQPVQQQQQQPTASGFPAVNPGMRANPNAGPQVSQVDNVRQGDRGKTHGQIVSLHLEMAAYFRRPNFVPTLAQ